MLYVEGGFDVFNFDWLVDWCAWELSGLSVEDVLASSAPPLAAPEAEQHYGTHQRARRRQCGHDRLPSRALLVSTNDNSCGDAQRRIGDVLRDRGLRFVSGTYFSPR